MHITVRYKTNEAGRAKALKDCKAWLNTDYDRILNVLREAAREGATAEFMTMALGLQGIQGYPARELVQYAIETK